MRYLLIVYLFLKLLFLALPAHAQSDPAVVAEIRPVTPRVEIFFGPAVGQLGVGRPNNFPGYSTAVDFNLTRRLSLVGDFGHDWRTLQGVHYTAMTLSAGPELRFHRRTTPFVHVLVGAARNSYYSNTTGLAVLAGGGADIGLNKRFALRLSGDYVPFHLDGIWENRTGRIGVGLVIKLGNSSGREVKLRDVGRTVGYIG